MERKKISGCQGLVGERVNKQSTEDFYGSETIPYDTIMMDTYHYPLAQTHRIYQE